MTRALAIAFLLLSAASRAWADSDIFALSLLHQFESTPGNYVVSPFSIHEALEMVAVGAGGRTASQLNDVLAGSPAPSSQPDLQIDADEPYSVANGVWCQQGLPILPGYRQTLLDRFHSQIETTDFREPTKAAGRINEWVAHATDGKITGLISPDGIKPDDRLILINAIFLKAAWLTPFTPTQTRDEPFSTGESTGESTVNVPTMHGVVRGSFGSDADVDLILLPYDHDGLGLIILLPKKRDGLAALEKSLTPQKLAALENGRGVARFDLSLPKWENKSSMELMPTLQRMGIEDAFTSAADFSGISPAPLCIGKVIHQATIEVDEAGTEATAATGIHMHMLAAREAPPMVVKIDHPFLYLIQKNGGGPILFLGRMTNPHDGG